MALGGFSAIEVVDPDTGVWQKSSALSQGVQLPAPHELAAQVVGICLFLQSDQGLEAGFHGFLFGVQAGNP